MRKYIGFLSLLLILYFMLPATIGIVHIGMLWPTAILFLVAAHCFFPKWYKKLPKWLVVCTRAGVALFLTYALVISCCMIHYANNSVPEDEDVTVIVLGCEVRGDGPSLMLSDRIDSANKFLQRDKEAPCIASGGMDDDETITEAQCIRDTLVSLGVEKDRIFLEDKSGSTFENLKFSANLIQDDGFSSNVAIATDNFHQMRAQIFAKRNGLTPYAIGNRSFWMLGPGYWCREIIGITAMFVRGY